MKTTATVSAITLAFGRAAVAGQLNLICAMALEVSPLMAVNPKFRMAQYARDVEEASGYSISRKTLENAGAVARKFCTKFGAQILTYGETSEENVLLFADFIKEQVAKTTYNLTVMELSAWCDGKKSAADERAEKLAAMLAEQAKRVEEADKSADAVQAQGDKAETPAPAAEVVAEVVEVVETETVAAPVAEVVAEVVEAPAAEVVAEVVAEVAPRDVYAEMLKLADELSPEAMEQFAAAMLARAAEMRAAAAPKATPKSKREKIAA